MLLLDNAPAIGFLEFDAEGDDWRIDLHFPRLGQNCRFLVKPKHLYRAAMVLVYHDTKKDPQTFHLNARNPEGKKAFRDAIFAIAPRDGKSFQTKEFRMTINGGLVLTGPSDPREQSLFNLREHPSGQGRIEIQPTRFCVWAW